MSEHDCNVDDSDGNAKKKKGGVRLNSNLLNVVVNWRFYCRHEAGTHI